MKCCGGWNDQLAAHWPLYANVHIHPWAELQARIRKHKPYWQRARIHVQLWKDVVHSSGKDPAGIGVKRDRCWISRLDLCCVALKYLRQHPNIRKVGDGVQHGFGLDIHISERVFLCDVTGDGRMDGEV